MAIKNGNFSSDKKIGQIFTPDYIAEFMVKNVIRVLKDNSNSYSEPLKLDKLKVLEPASGQGIFLKFLLENTFQDITAYEIDESLSKYLELTYPEVDFRFQNFLSSRSNEKYDIIIGNPPYLGQNYNSSIFQELVQKYDTCRKYFVGNMDLFYYFIHLGIEKLKPGGFLSFITTNYWVTKSKKTGIKHLKPHIIENCYLLEYYDISYLKVFRSAKGQHNCIFILEKKKKEQNLHNFDKPIKIYQFRDDIKLTNSLSLENFLIYESSLNNFDLSKKTSWNLLYPVKIKKIVEKIEEFCRYNDELLTLKDIFFIRNGLILIKDDIFILEENKDLKLDNDDIYIRIDNEYVKINDAEKKCLKKLYKSSSIIPYGFMEDKSQYYLIYFNKTNIDQKNSSGTANLQKTYPHLTKYLKLHEAELKETLRNAKENPKNIYYPRRGAHILIRNENNMQEKIDLEPFYDDYPKIFFPYISNKNTFGFCTSSYYATSDTYFLWPKEINSHKIDYSFWVAYLNSKIVSFLFKAKNIKIKRSKTKLESNLPFPNLTNFQSIKQKRILSLIRNLSNMLIKPKASHNKFQLNKEIMDLINDTKIPKPFLSELTLEKNINSNFIKRIIDSLFFKLFDLDEEEIDSLINKYY